LQITAFDLAQRFVGVREVGGPLSNAHVLAMLRLDDDWVEGDHIPWCSALVNYVAWLLRLPRSKSLAARSWLSVGTPIPLGAASPAWDVVILSRGEGPQPGPEVLDAPGHVGFFAGLDLSSAPAQILHASTSTGVLPVDATVMILGGNQGDAVSVAPFPASRVLGVRRLYGPPDAPRGGGLVA
jgi:uncharacterized protein (TIGR02594 family)